MSGGALRRHSSFGFYLLSKTYIAIKRNPEDESAAKRRLHLLGCEKQSPIAVTIENIPTTSMRFFSVLMTLSK
jgi:hypothetical protein